MKDDRLVLMTMFSRELERDVEVEQLDRKSSRKSRRDSGTVTQQAETRAGWIGADDRRTSRQYSRVERDSAPAPAERTEVTTRRKTEVEENSPDEEEVERKSKSRYDSYSRAARSSTSKLSERRKSRAADVYAQASQRRSSSAAGGQIQRPKTSFTQRSRPPTMPPESIDNARSSRDVTGRGRKHHCWLPRRSQVQSSNCNTSKKTTRRRRFVRQR